MAACSACRPFSLHTAFCAISLHSPSRSNSYLFSVPYAHGEAPVADAGLALWLVPTAGALCPAGEAEGAAAEEKEGAEDVVPAMGGEGELAINWLSTSSGLPKPPRLGLPNNESKSLSEFKVGAPKLGSRYAEKRSAVEGGVVALGSEDEETEPVVDAGEWPDNALKKSESSRTLVFWGDEVKDDAPDA